MAKNFVGPGDKIRVTAPYALTSGQGALVQAVFGVAQNDAANGTEVVLSTTGVYDLTKEPALAVAQGVRVFWDNTNRRITTTATSNFHVGMAWAAALAADTTVRVKLDRGPAVGA
jgi:predicted RecA/RadA family phage recombinase